MPEKTKNAAVVRWLQKKVSVFFAGSLGVDAERKAELFLDLSRAATLKDILYWLQIVFGAGIATLGLVLNSPAVIIGAMLISPLMNPILSSGLALASGNLVLGLRAAFNLVLSCAAAVGFAVLLVVLLPFREMTSEIAARMQPNVLDLLIALFSGAVGSAAICREVKGVVTSIPGVAIAVALMPPLCVVGYGIGLAIMFDTETGWRVTRGGSLLFLTNLVAITLTAMIVFWALKIDTPQVREKVEEWEQKDAESRFVLNAMQRFPGLEKARQIHSLSLRASMIILPLILILVPLSSAFSQLRDELARKQRESEIRQVVTDVWQENFQKKGDGAARSTIDYLTVAETDEKLNINLRVFDDSPYSLTEKKRYTVLLASKLNRPVETINLNLTEIPTVSVLDALTRTREEKEPPRPPTVAELRENLLERVELALNGFEPANDVRIVRKQVVAGVGTPLEIKIVYLSDEQIAPETKTVLTEKLRADLKYADATVSFERIPARIGEIAFSRNGAELTIPAMLTLDFTGRTMRENPKLILKMTNMARRGERDEIIAARMKAVAEYLETRWQISPERIKPFDGDEPKTEGVELGFQTNDAPVEVEKASEQEAKVLQKN